MPAHTPPPTHLHYRTLWQVIGWIMVAVIVWLSLTPKPPHLPSFFGWDKAEHLLAYAVLMNWFGMCFVRHWRWPALIFGLGIALEILQGLGGFRTFDVADMVANALGVSLSLRLRHTRLGQWLPYLDLRLANGKR